jgi:hypothetical protein
MDAKLGGRKKGFLRHRCNPALVWTSAPTALAASISGPIPVTAESGEPYPAASASYSRRAGHARSRPDLEAERCTPSATTPVVSFRRALQQALRDLCLDLTRFSEADVASARDKPVAETNVIAEQQWRALHEWRRADMSVSQSFGA